MGDCIEIDAAAKGFSELHNSCRTSPPKRDRFMTPRSTKVLHDFLVLFWKRHASRAVRPPNCCAY